MYAKAIAAKANTNNNVNDMTLWSYVKFEYKLN